MIPPQTLQDILQEVARLGETGDEPSSLGALLAKAVVDTSDYHSDTTDLRVLIDTLAESHNPYVRQCLAFSVVEHVKWKVNRHQGFRLALAVWNKQRVPDRPETVGMLLQVTSMGLHASDEEPSPDEMALVVEKVLSALGMGTYAFFFPALEFLWDLREMGMLKLLPPEDRSKVAAALELYLPNLEQTARQKHKRKSMNTLAQENLEQTRTLLQELRAEGPTSWGT